MDTSKSIYGGDPSFRITRKTLTRDQKRTLNLVETQAAYFSDFGISASDVAMILKIKTYWAVQHLQFLTKNGFIADTPAGYKGLKDSKQ